jgi:hypothetical protein
MRVYGQHQWRSPLITFQPLFKSSAINLAAEAADQR